MPVLTNKSDTPGVVPNPSAIGREFQTHTLALTASLSTTPAFDFRRASGGTLHLGASSGITTITFYVAAKMTDTFVPLLDTTKAAVAYGTLSVGSGGNAIPIPDACFGAGFIAIVVNTAETVIVSVKG